MTKEQFDKEREEISNNELIDLCNNELTKLCKIGGKSFTMSVPVRVKDTDMLFSLLLKRFREMSNYIKGERQKITEEKLIGIGFVKDNSGYKIWANDLLFELNLDFHYVSDDGYTYPNKLVYMDDLCELYRLLFGIQLIK